ncbi:MAG: glycosyltransferase family 2 protein [Acetobacterium sp.]
MRKISVVIPCYGSEKTIATVVEEVIETVKKRAGFEYEIILVNDYSPDGVWSKIEELSAENKSVQGINFSKNFGQHAALMAGYGQCSGEIVISLDDDGQSPADELFSLIDKIDQGYDVVYGSYEEKKHSKFRNFGSYVNKIMNEKLVSKPRGLNVTSYYAAKDYIIAEIIRYNNPYPYVGGLIFRATQNIAEVSVKHRNREFGNSGYTLAKLVKLWLNGFTAFSVKPLRFATTVGFICSILGFGYGCYTIVNKLINPAALLGYSSTMAAMMFIGGMLMLMLGLIGEYVGRIYISLNEAPQYVIKENTAKVGHSEIVQ